MPNLSISSSKIMKYLKAGARLIAFLIIGAVLYYLMNYALSESKRDWVQAGRYYPLRQWQEYYRLPPNSIDLLILGSSRAFYGIDPQLIEDSSGLSAFNLGSPAQPFPASYYILEEVLQKHDIKYLVLELHYEMITRFYTRPYKIYIFENMRGYKRKLDYFINGFTLREKGEFFLPALNDERNITYIFNKLTGNLDEQFNENEYYTGKGFVKSLETLDLNNHNKDEFIWNDSQINPEFLEYYHKILTLAQENDISVIVVNFPYTQFTTINQEDEFWDNYHELIRISDNLKILDYHNGSIEFETRDFFDIHHLNWYGSQKITQAIIEHL